MIRNRRKIQRLILTHKEDICVEVLLRLKKEFPRSSYDQDTCLRDLRLIIDAAVQDYVNGSHDGSTDAGMAYVYSYNGIVFTYQKTQTLYAIHELKVLVLDLVNDVEVKADLETRFDAIIDIVSDKTVKEVKWWDFAGRVAPFVALAVIALSHLIGDGSLYHLSIITVILIFFTTGVAWWWWSIYKIVTIITKIRQSQYKFRDVTQEIQAVKKTIDQLKDSNDSNRKRGKPSCD